MKIGIMVVYFGQFPSYFNLFLKSCRANPKFNWIIISDNISHYDYPTNVKLINMSFEDCQAVIQEKFDFEISLLNPSKICDYKCAYGYIFSKYLHEFDWWGHCDLDQIFGNLSSFITDEKLKKYDKIYALGHLTLYRNTNENNVRFMSKLYGRERYREVFLTDKGCAFDEWLPGNVNEIFMNNGVCAFYGNDGADIDLYHYDFRLMRYDIKQKMYIRDSIRNSIFMWKNGTLYQVYKYNGTIEKKEFAYIHLQKRKMRDKRMRETDSFFIIPNSFEDSNINPISLIKKNLFHKIINTQWIIVKYKSFMYRLKSGNWRRQNVTIK